MQFQIYSYEHHGWWRSNMWGYTPNRDEAGWYNAADTFRILYNSAMDGAQQQPKEVAVDSRGMWWSLGLLRSDVGMPRTPAIPPEQTDFQAA